MTTYVFGHKNPDPDAICSALAYANYLRLTGQRDAKAACCGHLNERTKFVLERAGLEAPMLIEDVRLRVADVCDRACITTFENDVFYIAYQTLRQHGLRTVPVLSQNGNLVGILNLLDLLEVVLHGDESAEQSRCVNSTLELVRQVLNAQFQHSHRQDENEELILFVGAMSALAFAERLDEFPADRMLVVMGDQPSLQLAAIERHVRSIILTGGCELSPGLLTLAQANQVTIIRSPFDTATTAMRVKSSRFIGEAVQRDIQVINDHLTLEEAAEHFERTAQSMLPVVDESGELVGTLSRVDLVDPAKPKLVLVDHNELGQAVQGAEDADIVEVIDHHRLGGGLKSAQPIRFINEPVGSTCTLVARMYRQSGFEPNANMALCMASGIISDTLHLRSPTTTDVDRNILEWLQGFCKVELEEYSQEYFAVGSPLRTNTADQVVQQDCKRFEESNQQFSISQTEEIGFDSFWEREAELRTALAQLRKQNRHHFSCLVVTDIVTSSSLLLISNDTPFWSEMSYPKVGKLLYQLDGVVSRKKQILPLLTRLIRQARQPSEVSLV